MRNSNDWFRALLGGAVVTVLGLTPASGWAQDVANARDHPLVRRVGGSNIIEYKVVESGRCDVPLGPARGNTFTEFNTVNGKVTRIEYAYRPGLSVEAVYREFARSFEQAGMRPLFTCADASCGTGTGPTDSCNRPWYSGNDQRQFTGAAEQNGSAAIISLHVHAPERYARTIAVLSVIETSSPTPREEGVGVGMPKALTDQLRERGFTELGEPVFQEGSTRLTDNGERIVRGVAGFLKQNPRVRLFIVNHTDNDGRWESEMELSRGRAQAVARTLTSKYGIAANRLSAQGVGPLAPVADLRTEPGRKRNTRTTLVVME